MSRYALTPAYERWLAVVGYEGLYEVSDLGRVRSLARTVPSISRGKPCQRQIDGRILQPRKNNRGYLYLGLYRDGQSTTRTVHRLVLEAFVGPCPPGEEACHLSSVKTDNRAINLWWDTKDANARDQLLAETRHNAGKTHCINGHEFTPENTIIRSNRVGRSCRKCARQCNRRRYAANRDLINAQRRRPKKQRETVA